MSAQVNNMCPSTHSETSHRSWKKLVNVRTWSRVTTTCSWICGAETSTVASDVIVGRGTGTRESTVNGFQNTDHHRERQRLREQDFSTLHMGETYVTNWKHTLCAQEQRVDKEWCRDDREEQRDNQEKRAVHISHARPMNVHGRTDTQTMCFMVKGFS